MIVGICGAAGAGKDTAADALVDSLEYKKGMFAQPLKEMACQLFGWSMADLESLAFKEAPNDACYGRTPRQVLQTLGTDWGREMVGPNIWVDAALRYLKQARTVYSDVRFPNEAKIIRESGGILVYVTCVDQAAGTDSNQHASELWLPWLHAYADVEISALFGCIDQLQEGVANTVRAYLHEDLPRFVDVSQETRDLWDNLERETLLEINGA
jgi:hypothetical protein